LNSTRLIRLIFSCLLFITCTFNVASASCREAVENLLNADALSPPLTVGARSAIDAALEVTAKVNAEKGERKKFETVVELQKKIARDQKLINSNLKVTQFRLEQRMSRLETFLAGRDLRAAINMVQRLLVEVEYLVIDIRKSETHLLTLRAGRAAAEAEGTDRTAVRKINESIETVEKTLAGALKRFGPLFEEYYSVRKHLETAHESPEVYNPNYLESVRQVNAFLNVVFENKRGFPNLIGNEMRPTLIEVRDTLQKYPDALIAKLTHESNMQKFAFAQFIWLHLAYTAKWVADKVDVYKTRSNANPVKWAIGILNATVFKWAFDYYAQFEHFPKINSILRDPSSNERKFEMILELAENDPGFLFSFARRINALDLWNSMETYLDGKVKENGPKAADYKYLYDKMERAEKARDIYGYLASEVGGNPTAKVMTGITVISGISWYAATHWEQLKESLPGLEGLMDIIFSTGTGG